MTEVITRYRQYFNIVKAYNEQPLSDRRKIMDQYFPAVMHGITDYRVYALVERVWTREHAQHQGGSRAG